MSPYKSPKASALGHGVNYSIVEPYLILKS